MTKKHLLFYQQCLQHFSLMPENGLCGCARNEHIDIGLFSLFEPTGEDAEVLFKEKFTVTPFADGYWGAGTRLDDCSDIGLDRPRSFTPLRQTIVLFMAAIAGEL